MIAGVSEWLTYVTRSEHLDVGLSLEPVKLGRRIVAPHNKALQLTVNPLRGLSAAELGR